MKKVDKALITVGHAHTEARAANLLLRAIKARRAKALVDVLYDALFNGVALSLSLEDAAETLAGIGRRRRRSRHQGYRAPMIGKMERNVGGLLIYKNKLRYMVKDCRTSPFHSWGTLPLTFNPHQGLGQLQIFFLAHGDRNAEEIPAAEENLGDEVHVRRDEGVADAVQEWRGAAYSIATEQAAERG